MSTRSHREMASFVFEIIGYLTLSDNVTLSNNVARNFCSEWSPPSFK
jgi:hypothetical protein